MGANNSYRIKLSENNQYINIPIEITWDFTGRDEAIDEFEKQAISEVIGTPTDFEVARFPHKSYSNNTKTDINYDFYFYSGNPASVISATSSNWVINYVAKGFSIPQIYYYSKTFTNSFFKLDFYDTNNEATQTNYITIILPVQNGVITTGQLSPLIPLVNVRKPSYKLDYVGDKEGFFIYWLRNTDFLNINEFYMTAKFFDARIGQFVKMMNVPQSSLTAKFNFKPEDYFYYKVNLDYTTLDYQIFDMVGNRIGTTSSIKWYEYVNPQ